MAIIIVVKDYIAIIITIINIMVIVVVIVIIRLNIEYLNQKYFTNLPSSQLELDLAWFLHSHNIGLTILVIPLILLRPIKCNYLKNIINNKKNI